MTCFRKMTEIVELIYFDNFLFPVTQKQFHVRGPKWYLQIYIYNLAAVNGAISFSQYEVFPPRGAPETTSKYLGYIFPS